VDYDIGLGPDEGVPNSLPIERIEHHGAGAGGTERIRLAVGAGGPDLRVGTDESASAAES
jgi:hypothetical protein